ncbi:chromate resistance protein [Candidatus Poribacteria bacterium]|nr:chromate resistance protein [Candidatus Poribacteria bacterium]
MHGVNANRWIMLMYQLPTKPSNLRVKIWRRIQKLGAIGIRNSAYVLPNRKSCVEDFQWLKHEIVDMGGEASVFSANSLDGAEDEEVERMFRDVRDSDYESILEVCKELSELLDDDVEEDLLSSTRIERYEARLSKIMSMFDEVRRIDFFSAPLGTRAKEEIERLRSYVSQIRGFEDGGKKVPVEDLLDVEVLKGKTWVTRKGLHIDRVASGWLIKKFIDHETVFEFVDEDGYVQQENHVPFDMYGAEFGHQGEYCTFETLVRRLGLSNNHRLMGLAEIVHDVDLKDSKFGRPEAKGIDKVIIGLGKVCENDYQLLELGGKVFDALYACMEK